MIYELNYTNIQLHTTLSIPRFQNGDYVLIATPHSTKQHKLTATWKGPYRALKPISDYVYSCQHLITQKDLTAHIRRIRYYSNQHIDIPVGLLDTIQHESNAHHMYHIENIVDVQQDRDTSEWKVLIKWEGFSELENTWEDIQQIHQSHPQLTQVLSTHSHGQDNTCLGKSPLKVKIKTEYNSYINIDRQFQFIYFIINYISGILL
jgi:hypothetical protein